MNFLVTGCAGFIGSHMVDFLLDKGHAVVGVDCFTYAAQKDNLKEAFGNPRFRLYSEDVCNSSYVAGICDSNGVNYILNFAAETHVDNSINDCSDFITSNILGAKSMLDVCRLVGIKMLHVSTDEVYGSCREGAFVEGDKLDPRNPYSATKAAAEHMVTSYENTYGTEVIMVRPSNNFGPRQHGEKFLPTIIRSLNRGEKIPVYGRGLNVRDWLFVRDNVAAIYHLATESKCIGTYNITSGNEMSNIELVKRVCAVLDLDWSSCIEYVPDRAGHDFRYSIDASRLAESGFVFRSNFQDNLRETIDELLRSQA